MEQNGWDKSDLYNVLHFHNTGTNKKDEMKKFQVFQILMNSMFILWFGPKRKYIGYSIIILLMNIRTWT